jgi:hypothetical protein
MSQSVSAEINWPLVAGLGVAAGVLIYALHIVNNQLGQADNLLGGAANDVQTVLSPITGLFNWVGNLFSGDSDASTSDN